MMTRALRRAVSAALFMAAYLTILPASPAFAAEEPYAYNPLLSLVGGCVTSEVDPVPDPGCPDGAHPSSPFKLSSGVAIDAYGNEYVAVAGNETGTAGRIDIFDDEGFFIGEIPDPHGPQSLAVDNKGTLYVIERGNEGSSEVARYYPSAGYDPLAGEIDYDITTRKVITINPNIFGSLAVDPSTNRLFVVSVNVQEYASVDELTSPEEANPLLNEIKERGFDWTAYVAVDGQRRRIFVSSCKDGTENCGILIFKADPPYELIGEVFEFNGSTKFASTIGLLGIAVNEETGHFFVQDIRAQVHRIYEFDADFKYVATIEQPFLQALFRSQIAVSNSALNPTAKNHGVLFSAIASPSGKLNEVFAFKKEPIGRPEVESAEALHVSQTEGVIQATINPGGAETTYVVTVEEEGSGIVRTVGGGTIAKDSLPRRITAPFAGLVPGAQYRFKVEASNVKGSDAKEGSFATYSDASLTTGVCPNEDLRVGLSSSLPDCRAFELVTPADTNGRPARGAGYPGSTTFPISRVSPDGSAISFLTEGGPLPGFEGTGSFAGDRYRVIRGDSGWSPVRFGPTGTETETPKFGGTSPEQGFGVWEAEGNGSATIGGFGHRTSYLEFPDGHVELVGIGSLGVDSWARAQQLTENASHLIFQTENEDGDVPHTAVQLEPNAPPDGTGAVYDRTADGITHVVSLLPDGSTPSPGENAIYIGASKDGAGIAFQIGDTLYLRSNNSASYEIGDSVDYAGVAEGGHRIFYVENEDLLAYDTDRNEVIEFTKTGNAKVVNVAPSGQRAYFVSTTVISGAGANPLGARPHAGQQNLYLSDEGEVSFVGTVTNRDVEGAPLGSEGIIDGLGLWATAAEGGEWPSLDPSRVSPDGSSFIFQSRANLDGESGGAPQIYRYNGEEEKLQCISCNPTGLPEGGGSSLQTIGVVNTSLPPMGSKILIPNITPDGRRVVFESKEALVSTDNDAVQDIYEWEEAGVGSCTRAGGCVYLLSSGHSSGDNFLFGMSRSADDVFFVTSDALLAGDSSTASIYDARVGGGFAQEAEEICVGEGCRPGMASAPTLTSPASTARGAHDNVKPRKCAKGKRKVKRRGKVRCVKRHRKHQRKHRTAGEKKEAAR